jgi:flagellar hook protein FlgE
MSTGFSNSVALSGLDANAQAINIISGNLANLSTAGYKDQQVSFDDLVNESLSGFSHGGSISGSTAAHSTQQFTQGTLNVTNNPYDAAIQGGGFFVVDNAAGEQLLTREGNFTVNDAGQLVTATGQFVQGWNAVNGALNTNGVTSNITLPTSLTTQPAATSNITISANLDANAASVAADQSFSSPVQVYDSLGEAHTLTVNFTYSPTATPPGWSFDVTMPSADIAGGSGAATTLVPSQALTFSATGLLQLPQAGPLVNITTVGTGSNNGVLTDGAAALNINWNLFPNGQNAPGSLTQYAQASANTGTTQDGSAPGTLTSMSIGSDGQVMAAFSNGTTQAVAQIAVASVLNPDSMQQLDGNTFAPTSLTAAPSIGMPSTGARGSISGGALETSTVDIATEFTNLLQYERGYQANSKVISTEDQVIQQTIGLITG